MSPERQPAAPVGADGPADPDAAHPPVGWTPPAGTPTRLLLVRHGSTAHSLERRFSGRNDLPLDPAGAAQAAALAARLQHRDEIVAVVSSPLRRAVQTAQSIAAGLGHSPTVDEDLAELDFGAWEGLTFAEARERDAAALAAWAASPDVAPPGGESFTALTQRVQRARERLVAAHRGRTVLVVSHVSPIKVLVRLALDAPPRSVYRMHLDTASITVIEAGADGSSSLRVFNDTAHLA